MAVPSTKQALKIVSLISTLVIDTLTSQKCFKELQLKELACLHRPSLHPLVHGLS